MLSLARRFDRSAYDAAYLTLAEARQEPLITADLRLYNAVRDHLDWVRLVSEVWKSALVDREGRLTAPDMQKVEHTVMVQLGMTEATD